MNKLTQKLLEGDAAPHACQWGPPEVSRFAGTPHRKCLICGAISLDTEDEGVNTDVDPKIAGDPADLDYMGRGEGGRGHWGKDSGNIY